MNVTAYRAFIKVDASGFEKEIGDLLEKGEIFGLGMRVVKAPFRAIVEDISVDAEDHALIVCLVEAGR